MPQTVNKQSKEKQIQFKTPSIKSKQSTTRKQYKQTNQKNKHQTTSNPNSKQPKQAATTKLV